MTELPLALALALLAHAHASRQDGGGPPGPPGPPPSAAPAPILASDGEPAAPGRLPVGTSDEAVRRWERMLAAVLGAAPAGRPRVVSFDLELDVTVRRDNASNDTEAGFRYLEDPEGPYLRAYLEKRDLVLLRGPSGDFLIDGPEVHELVGQDDLEDIRQLQEYTAICRNFLSLTRPDQIRIVRLEERDPEPTDEGDSRTLALAGQDGGSILLPDEALARTARDLDWLYVESPDFRLAVEPAGGRRRSPDAVPRTLLGLDRSTGQIRIALLAGPGRGSLVGRDSLLVLVSPYKELDGGWRLPGSLEVRQVVEGVWPRTFAGRDGTQVWVKGGSRLNPPLTQRDFRPPG